MTHLNLFFNFDSFFSSSFLFHFHLSTFIFFLSLLVFHGWGCIIHRQHHWRDKNPPPTSDPVGWGYRIHRLHHCRGVMLELWGMRSTSSSPLLPGPIRLGVVAPDRDVSIGQIELNCILLLNWTFKNRTVLTLKLCTNAELNCLK